MMIIIIVIIIIIIIITIIIVIIPLPLVSGHPAALYIEPMTVSTSDDG